MSSTGYKSSTETPEVGGGGEGGPGPFKNLGYKLTLFGPREADYAAILLLAPPIFLDDASSLVRYTKMHYEHHINRNIFSDLSQQKVMTILLDGSFSITQ